MLTRLPVLHRCGARGGILHGASASSPISDCSFRIADDPPGSSFAYRWF